MGADRSESETGAGLRSVTYVSSAADLMTAEQLLGLLEDIRPRNAELGLSGMLLYSGGNIMQVLEGPASAVARTFALIQHDVRHHDVIVLLDEEIDERAFPEWTMGFRDVGLPGDEVRALGQGADGLNDVMSGGTVTARDCEQPTAPDVVRLLELFRKNMR